MAYSNQTPNYGLPLPLGTDKSNFMDTNTAFTAVDTALKGAVDGVAALSGTTGGISEALTGLTNRVDGIDTDITQLKNADGTIVGNFGPVETGQVSAHEYAPGDMFVWLNVIRKATVAIHVGDQFVNGTNCVIVSLDEIIGNLNVINEHGSISEALSVNHWTKIAEVSGDGVALRGALINTMFPLIQSYLNGNYDLFFEHVNTADGFYERYIVNHFISGEVTFFTNRVGAAVYQVDFITVKPTASKWTTVSGTFPSGVINGYDHQDDVTNNSDIYRIFAKPL